MTKRRKNFIPHTFQTTMKLDGDKRTVSKAETLYVSLMCLVVSCLSFATLEVGARSPLGHSATKSATFNALFRRNYNTKINVPTGNLVSALMSTIALAIGEKFRIPYLYLPWLANTLRGMAFHEGPALVGFSYNQLPHAVVPATTFAFITFILYVEELCLWCDVFASFKRCWAEYMHHRDEKGDDRRENTIAQDQDPTKNLLQPVNLKKSDSKPKHVTTLHQSPKMFEPTPVANARRAKSLIDMNNHEKLM